MKIKHTKILDDVTIKIEVKFDKIDDDLFELLSFLDFPTKVEQMLKEEFKNDNSYVVEEQRNEINGSGTFYTVKQPIPPRPYMRPDSELFKN